jgi:hypothetical protein
MQLKQSANTESADDFADRVLGDEASRMHPLELMPFFRGRPQSLARDVIYTVILNTLFAIFFQLASLANVEYRSLSQFFDMALSNFIISNGIGFTFYITYTVLGPLLRRINRLPFWGVVCCYTLMGFVIVQAGFFFTSFVPGFAPLRNWMGSAQWFATTLSISFIVSLVMGLAWRARIEGLMRESAVARERSRVEAAERAAAEANLRALQAQIEPHFLFNTLANVLSLIEPSPQKARLMLQDFIDYLRASLASTRAQTSSLGREVDLMRAFLRLIQIRMGERLRFRVEIPDNLRALEFPPMLLQPLIENAVKHGLEPTVDGGEIVVRAQALPGFLEITVDDDGRGFQGDAQSGLGLANVRERIAGIFGAAADFIIESREPAGTRVLIRVPQPALLAVQEAA